MSEETKTAIRFTVIVGLGVAFMISLAWYYESEPIIKLVPVQVPIPSAREIQQRLKDLDDPRYDPGPIDGIPGPKMIRGWDNLIKDRYAIRAVEGR